MRIMKLRVENYKLEVIRYALLLGVLALLFAVVACVPKKDKVFRKSKMLMDTVVTITVVTDSDSNAEKAIDNSFAVIEKIENLLNFYSDKSEVSGINKNAGTNPVKVSPETMEIIEKAIQISELTQGRFDITIGPVMELWNFHNKKKPDDRTIKSRLHLVGYKSIAINKAGSTVYLKKNNMKIDLGGVAKGYAADKAVEELKKNGIKSGLVAIAGDIKAFGLKPDGRPWKIGIKNPRQKGQDDEIIAVMELTDMAISTSGDYERYFIEDGKRYHHLLNPKTGYPADSGQSVSIITKDGAIADPLSTGIFIIGHEKGIKLLEENKISGFMVDKEGMIHITSDLRGKIEIKGHN